MKNILVIGGSGFIGRNIIDKLISYNLNVYVYDIKKIELWFNFQYILKISACQHVFILHFKPLKLKKEK